MKSFLAIIKKNFKLLIRSRVSALIIILGPLLVVSLVGMAFSNSQQYAISVGAYSSEYTELTDSLIKKLTDNNYRVVKFQNAVSCVSSVKRGVTNVCVIFPKDLEIKQDKTNQITFYVDYSRVNLVWMVLNTITQKVSAESEEISMDLTQGLLEKLSETATTMDDDKIVVDGLVDGNQELTDKMNVLYSNLRDIELDIDEDDFKLVYHIINCVFQIRK